MSPRVLLLPTRTRAVLVRAALLVAAGLTLGGCGGDDADQRVAAGAGDAGAEQSDDSPSPTSTGAPGDADPTPSAAPSPTASPAVTDTPEPGEGPSGQEPPFPANTQPDTGESQGAGLSVTDVEVGRHEGYDRVVFTLGGEGVPGWRVEYVDTPTRQGSGEPFDVPGEAFLSVLITGVGYPFDTGVDEYDGPRTISPSGTEVVRGVQVQGVYEGQYDGAIGLTAEKPFRVFRLDGPPRVVVDVLHEG